MSDQAIAPQASESTTQQLALEALHVLFKPGEVAELRILGTNWGRKGTLGAGYYDFKSFDLLSKVIAAVSDRHDKKKGRKIEGLYVTLNPVDPRLLARYYRRVEPNAALTTSDNDIARRTHLLIDCDPVRPAGISSSDAEKQLAADIASQVKEHLTSRGWPAPLEFDSGNGYHLIYNIDLPNDDASRDLIKSCLEALASKFDSTQVEIDQKVFNAGRVCKAYASMSGKGDDVAVLGRPHRRSRLLHAPEELKTVPLELLQALAAEAPTPAQDTASESSSTVSPEKFESQLNAVGVELLTERASYQGGWMWHLECPFNRDHKNTAIVGIRSTGAMYFNCLHKSCQGYSWQQFRAEMEKRSGKKMRFKAARPSITDEQVLARFRADPRASAAWNGQLDQFDGSAQKASDYLASYALQNLQIDVDSFVRIMQSAPLTAALEAQFPEYLR